MAHARRLIGASALHLDIVGDTGLGIEHAVADRDAGEHAGDRLGDGKDDVRPLGLGVRREPFVEHDAVAHHHEAVGKRVLEMLERRHARAIGVDDRQAGDQAGLGNQLLRAARRRDFGGRHQLPDVLERPLAERMLPPIGERDVAARKCRLLGQEPSLTITTATIAAANFGFATLAAISILFDGRFGGGHHGPAHDANPCAVRLHQCLRGLIVNNSRR